MQNKTKAQQQAPPQVYSPEVLALVDEIRSIMAQKLDRLEQGERRAKALGHDAVARQYKQQASEIRIHNVAKRMGSTTFEMLLEGRIKRLPSRERLAQFATEITCTSEQQQRLFAAAGYEWSSTFSSPRVARELTAEYLALLDALPYPAFVIDADKRIRAVNQLGRFLWQLPSNANANDLEKISLPAPGRFSHVTSGHSITEPASVQFVTLPIEAAAGERSTVFGVVPFDEVAQQWCVAIGLPAMSHEWRDQVLAQRALNWSVKVIRTAGAAGAVGALGATGGLVAGFAGVSTAPVWVPALLVAAPVTWVTTELIQRRNTGRMIAKIGTSYRVHMENDEHQEDPSVAEDFLQACGLRYVGTHRTVVQHIMRITSDPAIPLSHITDKLGISSAEGLGFLKSLECGPPAYVSAWAKPLGELLGPMIVKALDECDVLADGYALSQSRVSKLPEQSPAQQWGERVRFGTLRIFDRNR